MNYETVSAEDFGAALRGIGLNILVTDVRARAEQLRVLFGMEVFRLSADFAILRYGADVFQLHSDGTYASNPYLGMLPENPPRGAGIELRLYETDPDTAEAAAEQNHFTVLQTSTNKPHGLRECYLLCPDGYAWVPSRPLTAAERSAV